ncbi:Protein of unknown function [Tangfeifania diversioriginum]|uniref:DUF3822 family protein n=2 Tax=Tangfeifania diversioriginum TaxID=1168035 RepID=A0A1M6LDG7_9BACT|nr:Protein of unknown function [Tangfeifania diversioriginum]
MHDLITDQSFEPKNISEYKLSIQVSLDGFSFFVTHKTERRLLALKSTRVTISSEKFLARRFAEWANSEEILSKPFSSVTICFITPKFTLVPNELYEKNKASSLVNLLFDAQVKSQIIANAIDELSTTLLFSIPVELKNEFDKVFNSYTLIHTGKVLAQQSLQLIGPQETGLTLFFSPDNFSLFLHKEGTLILTNSFTYSHPNDVLYYSLTALKQYKIAPKQCKVLISGQIEKESDYITLLKNYFGQTYFLLPDFESTPEPLNEPLHQFISLL